MDALFLEGLFEFGEDGAEDAALEFGGEDLEAFVAAEAAGGIEAGCL